MNYIRINKKYLTEKLKTLNICFENYKSTWDDEFVIEEYMELSKIEDMINTSFCTVGAYNNSDLILNYLKFKYPELKGIRSLEYIEDMYKFLSSKLSDFYEKVDNYVDKCFLDAQITSKNYTYYSKIQATEAKELLEKLDQIYGDG